MSNPNPMNNPNTTAEAGMTPNSNEMRTVIGAGATIRGEIKLDADATIFGTIEGRLEISGALDVGENAQIEARIECGRLNLAGTVRGDVIAQEGVELGANASLIGDVYATHLTIPPGATCQGQLHIGQNASEAAKAGVGLGAAKTLPASNGTNTHAGKNRLGQLIETESGSEPTPMAVATPMTPVPAGHGNGHGQS